MKVALEEAYAEACRALGESIVRERLLTQALAQSGQEGGEEQALTAAFDA